MQGIYVKVIYSALESLSTQSDNKKQTELGKLALNWLGGNANYGIGRLQRLMEETTGTSSIGKTLEHKVSVGVQNSTDYDITIPRPDWGGREANCLIEIRCKNGGYEAFYTGIGTIIDLYEINNSKATKISKFMPFATIDIDSGKTYMAVIHNNLAEDKDQIYATAIIRTPKPKKSRK